MNKNKSIELFYKLINRWLKKKKMLKWIVEEKKTQKINQLS